MSTALKGQILGGWHYSYPSEGRPRADGRHLFQVSVPTSLDSWNDYILARNLAQVEAWMKITYPGPHWPGYEPTIKQLDCGLDTIYLLP